MFFILNNEKAVLAADKAFLESVGVPSIFLLAELFRSGDFLLDEDNHTYQIGGATHSFIRTPLQTTFGRGYFYRIEDEVVAPGLAIPPETDRIPVEEETSSSPDETLTIGGDSHLSADDPTEEEIPVTLPLSVPYGLEEATEEPIPQAPHTEEVPTPEFSLPDLPEVGSDIPEGNQTPSPDLEASLPPAASPSQQESPAPHREQKLDLPNLEEPSTSKMPEDDLLDLLDLEEDTPPEFTSQKTQSPSVPESDSREDDLLDLLDLEEKVSKETDTSELEIPAVGAAIAGAAGAALLADEAISPTEEKSTQVSEEEDIFDLLDTGTDTDATEKNKPTPMATTPDPSLTLKKESAQSQPTTPILPDTPFADYRSNAEMIGITSEEYLGFLKQFTEESLGYESGLKSQDFYVFKKNLTSIKDASQLLHLPQLSETVNKMEEATSDERHALIDDFFHMIHHIRRDLESERLQEEKRSPSDTYTQKTEPEPTAYVPEPDTHMAPPVSLADIEPIPFDFSTKAASDELGLPETLVQEFVSDFVKQAEENITVFQDAQQKGDIDTIQKTAHLLKGAASNLRIDPLADTLKELQYNEDLKNVPDLFKQFVGQLKSLVNFSSSTDK